MSWTGLKTKGQGLSINVIILIALGLVILIIAILLVNRSGKNLSDNTTKSCISQGGSCQETWCTGDYIRVPEGDASCSQGGSPSNPKPYCCRYNFGGEATP